LWVWWVFLNKKKKIEVRTQKEINKTSCLRNLSVMFGGGPVFSFKSPKYEKREKVRFGGGGWGEGNSWRSEKRKKIPFSLSIRVVGRTVGARRGVWGNGGGLGRLMLQRGTKGKEALSEKKGHKKRANSNAGVSEDPAQEKISMESGP